MGEGRLSGKVAWISGATSGIGEATAELFAEEGAAVALIGRRVELSEQIADRIRTEGGRAMACACDVSSEDQVRTTIEETAERFGGIHIVVNNAGMVQVKPLHEYSSEEWDYLMAVNVKSMFFAVKHALPFLKAHRQSRVVNVGSISSFVGQATTPVYTTSKHAVLGLTRSIALDYAADGVLCNCVCPGITLTPMLQEHLDKTGDAEAALRTRLGRVPLGRPLTPRDVAKSILYFASDDSAGVTGTSLVVDAGYLTAAEWHTEPIEEI
jgi:NAD(P)-dependent dehydrogenase (short-subunit alcohol dehydrogenase family)